MSPVFILLFIVAVASAIPPIPPPFQDCGPHGVFNDCTSNCSPTCKIRTSRAALCATVCLPGCLCDPGYIKKSKYGKCILPEDCDK